MRWDHAKRALGDAGDLEKALWHATYTDIPEQTKFWHFREAKKSLTKLLEAMNAAENDEERGSVAVQPVESQVVPSPDQAGVSAPEHGQRGTESDSERAENQRPERVIKIEKHMVTLDLIDELLQAPRQARLVRTYGSSAGWVPVTRIELHKDSEGSYLVIS